VICSAELLVLDDPDVLGRVVRVLSTRPFGLESLRYGRPGRDGRRQVVLSARLAEGAPADLLAKRLNRIVSVVRVRVLAAEISHGTRPARRGVNRVARP
jgi:acetolactate synthase small subunit